MEPVGQQQEGNELVEQQLLSVLQPCCLRTVCVFHLLRFLEVHVNNSNYWHRRGVLQPRVCNRVGIIFKGKIAFPSSQRNLNECPTCGV